VGLTKTTKPWLLWAHDPCPDGGWSLRGEFDTKEEAIKAAQTLHAREEKLHQEMVEEHKQEGFDPWKRGDNCYDRCIVTGGEAFSLGWDPEAP